MDREKIEAMVAEQERNMKQLQESALRVQGALIVLRLQLKRIDEAEAKAAEEAIQKRAKALRDGETRLSGHYPEIPMPGEPVMATVWANQNNGSERTYEWRGESDLTAIAYEFADLVPELPWELVEVEKDYARARTIYRRASQEASDGE